MNRKSTIVSLLALFFLNVTAFSQIISIEKNNCRVSNSDLRTIEKIAKLEKDLYNNFFNTHNNDSLFVKVNILGASEYKDAQSKSSGLHKTLGFYSPTLDECFVLKQPDYLKTVIHEMSHCMLRHNLKNPPRWLNEGIAEFCGTMLIEENKVSYTANAQRIKAVSDLVQTKPIDLKQLINFNNSEWHDLDKRSDLYSISYAVIYFLVKKNPSILKRMLLFMQEGQNSINALEYSYGGFYKFENDFNTFYKNTLIKPY